MDYLKEQLPDLDFADEITKNPQLEDFIKKECVEYEMVFTHPMQLETAPKLDTDFRNYFLLCGLPIVDEEKKEKLLKVLTNVFTKKGIEFIKLEDITILMDEQTGQSFGTAFIKCESDKQAKLASAAIHNFALGKANTIMSSTFDEFDRLLEVPEEYEQPRFADLTDLYTYAMDPKNDQFLIREANTVRIKLNKEPTRADKNSSSSDFHQELVGPSAEVKISTSRDCKWSPQGRYLVVIQDNIVQLYGGSKFDLIREILHSDVSFAHISPCENYIITYSKDAEEKEGNYNFWRIDTGELLRSFPFDENTPKNSPADIFHFSYDGKYCAKMIKDHVAVYELPSMHLLMDNSLDQKVSIRIDHIREFFWNPTRNMFCYWYLNSDENNTMPPKIGFIDIPSREVWSEKEIINGDDVKIEWSADGTKLIALCKLKIKKAYYNTVTLFDVTTRSIPMDIIKVESNVMRAEWVSSTNRLAIVANNEKKIKEKWEDAAQIAHVDVYDVNHDKGALISTKLGRSRDHIINTVIWADNGHMFIAADMKNRNASSQGKFYIYSVRTVITKQEKEGQQAKKGKKKGKPVFEEKREYVIDSVEDINNPRADSLVWDPTYRYFITAKLPKGKVRNAMGDTNFKFTIHNAKGDQLYSYSSAKLQQFLWRPRPTRTWPEKTEKDFKNQYKKDLRKQIVTEDEKEKTELLEVIKLQKEKTKEKFFEAIRPLQQRFADTKAERRRIGAEDDSEEEQIFTRKVMIDYY